MLRPCLPFRPIALTLRAGLHSQPLILAHPGKQDQLRDAHLYELPRPMLFISGTKDTFAEPSLLEWVVNRIGDRAKLVWIEGGDHSLKTKTGNQSLSTAAEEMDYWVRGSRS